MQYRFKSRANLTIDRAILFSLLYIVLMYILIFQLPIRMFRSPLS